MKIRMIVPNFVFFKKKTDWMIALIDQVTKSASNQSEENSFGSAHQKHKITRKLIAIYHKI